MVNKKQYILRQSALSAIFIFAALAFPALSYASTQYFYVLSSNYSQGMLMSLTSDPGVIEPSTIQNSRSLVGIVAPNDETSISQQAGQISIRTVGEADALVSTENGNIEVGDKIGASDVSGVGERLSGSGWIAGTAQASLDPSTKGAVKTSIKDSQGKSHTVYLKAVPVLVKVTYTSAVANDPSGSGIIASLQKLADKIVGKYVPVRNVLLSVISIMIGMFLAGMILNGAVRGGMLSIGRQPLTKVLIYKKIAQAFVVAAFLLLLGVVLAWVILKF